MTRVVISGATGTIGRGVCTALIARGDQPVALSRDAERARSALPMPVEVFAWPTPTDAPPPTESLAGADVVISLMGEPISQRWSAQVKRRIRESRVDATAMLVDAIRDLPEGDRPRVFVSQSATGYYGSRGSEELTEDASAGSDFLADVVVDWEHSALAARDVARVALTRTGLVISPAGGAISKMLPFFRIGIGGPVAGGEQYMPWIHIDDVIAGLLFCADHPEASGPLNLTSPQPVRNREFSQALGAALGRPAVLPVPAAALKLLYGEMADIVTIGQRAVPAKLLELGFEFRHPAIEPALEDVLSKD